MESWYVQVGTGIITIGDLVDIKVTAGFSTDIPNNTIHRVRAITNTVIVEVSTPELGDVVRLEDDYGRV